MSKASDQDILIEQTIQGCDECGGDYRLSLDRWKCDKCGDILLSLEGANARHADIETGKSEGLKEAARVCEELAKEALELRLHWRENPELVVEYRYKHYAYNYAAAKIRGED